MLQASSLRVAVSIISLPLLLLFLPLLLLLEISLLLLPMLLLKCHAIAVFRSIAANVLVLHANDKVQVDVMSHHSKCDCGSSFDMLPKSDPGKDRIGARHCRCATLIAVTRINQTSETTTTTNKNRTSTTAPRSTPTKSSITNKTTNRPQHR